MPPSKLFKATVSFDLYVLASDVDDAKGVATRNAPRELLNRGAYESIGDVSEVTMLATIDAEWRGWRPYATPGRQHERLTCSEALAAIQAERRRADLPGQQRLFGEGA